MDHSKKRKNNVNCKRIPNFPCFINPFSTFDRILIGFDDAIAPSTDKNMKNDQK